MGAPIATEAQLNGPGAGSSLPGGWAPWAPCPGRSVARGGGALGSLRAEFAFSDGGGEVVREGAAPK